MVIVDTGEEGGGGGGRVAAAAQQAPGVTLLNVGKCCIMENPVSSTPRPRHPPTTRVKMIMISK